MESTRPISRTQSLPDGRKKHRKLNTVTSLQKEVNRLTNTCDKLKEELRINVDMKKEYSSENERLKKAVDDCKENIEKLNNTVSALQKEDSNLQSTIQQLKEDNEKLQNVVKERENEKQRYNEDSETFREKCVELTKAKEDMRNEILHLRRKDDNLQHVCEDYKKEKAEADRKLENFKRENSDLKTMFINKQCKVDYLLAKNKELESKCETILQEISSLDRKTEARMGSTKTIITCENVQMGDSNNMGFNSLSNIESKLSQLIESIEALVRDKKEREKEIQQIKIEKKEMRETLAQLKDELDRLGPTETLSKQTSDCLAEIRDALEVLLTDRSDEQVIAEGVNLLKRQMSDCERKRQKLPPLSAAATSRILCKLGNPSIEDLADVFELDSRIIERHVGTRKLDRSIIVDVLETWMLQSSENDGKRLIERLKRHDASVTDETEKKFVIPWTMKNEDKLFHLNQRYDRVMDGQTQDMHVLLQCELMIDMKKDLSDIKSLLKCDDNTK